MFAECRAIHVQKKISVIIPAYNAEAAIRRCLDSMFAQTRSELELIVIDDGSTDATSDIVAALARNESRIVLLKQENQGVAAARNAGLNAATGSYIALQDADDYSHPRRMEQQFAFLERNPKYGFVGCDARLVDREGRTLGLQTSRPESTSGYVNASIMFRREVLESVRYNESLRYGEDSDLLRRVQRSSCGSSISLPLYFYVQGGEQLTTRDIVSNSVAAVMHKYSIKTVSDVVGESLRYESLQSARDLGVPMSEVENKVLNRLEYALRLNHSDPQGEVFQGLLSTIDSFDVDFFSDDFLSKVNALSVFYGGKVVAFTSNTANAFRGLDARFLARLVYRHMRYEVHVAKVLVKYRRWQYRPAE